MLTHNSRASKGAMLTRTDKRTIADDITANLAVLTARSLEQNTRIELLSEAVSRLLMTGASESDAITAARLDRAELVLVDMKSELDRIRDLIEEDALFAPVPVEEGYSDFQPTTPPICREAEPLSVQEITDLVDISRTDSCATDSVELVATNDIPVGVSGATLSVVPEVAEHIVEEGEPADLVGAYTIEEEDETDEQRERELDAAMAESVSAVAARLDSLHVKQPGELKKRVHAIEASFRQRQAEKRRLKALELSKSAQTPKVLPN